MAEAVARAPDIAAICPNCCPGTILKEPEPFWKCGLAYQGTTDDSPHIWKKKRRKLLIEWREPKLLTVFQTDEKGRMDRKSRPVIDGTLQGPDALIELVAFHLHRLGAAKAKVVTFAADQCALDLGAVGLGDCPGQTGSGPGCPGAQLVSRRASPEPGVDSVESGQGLAGPAVWPASHPAEGGPESDGDQGLGEIGLGQPEDAPVSRRDQLFDTTLRGGPAAVQLFPVPRRTAGQRCHREHDPPGHEPPAQGNSIYWTEENAEAVFQLRVAVVSGRWEEIVERTREAMARNRRTDWRWTPPECLARLKALDDEDDDLTQTSTRKRSKRSAA